MNPFDPEYASLGDTCAGCGYVYEEGEQVHPPNECGSL